MGAEKKNGTRNSIRSRFISQWSNTVILRILRNEKYVGDLCQKKTYTPNYLTHAKKVNRNAEEKIYLYNHHEPIIDRSLWNRTQEELDRRAPNRNTNSKYSNRYWCSGKLRCGKCGCQFVSRTKKLSNGIYKAWRCYQASNSETYKIDDVHKTCCNKNIINEKALLACMKHCIHLLCDSPIELKEEITSLIKSICNIPQNAHHKNKIQSQISNVEEKKSKSFDALLDGLITKEEFQKQTTRYREEINRLQNMLTSNNQYRTLHDRLPLIENTLNSILLFETNNELLYREILDKIVVYYDAKKGSNQLIIWMKYFPFGIRLKIKTTGKCDDYHTEILETTIVNKITDERTKNTY